MKIKYFYDSQSIGVFDGILAISTFADHPPYNSVFFEHAHQSGMRKRTTGKRERERCDRKSCFIGVYSTTLTDTVER